MKSFLISTLLCTVVLFPSKLQAQQATQIVDLDTSQFPLIQFKVQFPNRNEVKRYVGNQNTFVRENGVPQHFTIDCPIDQISFAIILDKSLSMAFRPNDPRPQADPDSVRWRSAKNAIRTFANSLVPPDSACLISFSRIATLGQDFTSDGDLIYQAVDSITLEEYTGTWVACMMGIDLLKVRPGKRVIILLNDGGENVRRSFGGPSYTDVINKAQQHDVVIHTIGLGEFTGTNILSFISSQTNGRYYLSADGSDLTNIYTDIVSSITSSPCNVSYLAEESCPNGSLRTIQITTNVDNDVFEADTSFHSPFNLESTNITTTNPSIVFPNEIFKVQMEFETYLRPDEPTVFDASFTYDNSAVDFLRLETDTGIFIEQPPVATTNEDGILHILGQTSIYSPQNKYLFTLYFRAKELQSARTVTFNWLNINIVRKCNTVSDGAVFTFAVDGVCDKIVRRKTPPILQSVFPNPATDASQIAINYQDETGTPVALTIVTQSGETLRTLLEGTPNRGTSTYYFNAQSLPSGIYWVRMRNGEKMESRKLIIAH